MNRPNLFSYATKELSQDGFLGWLLSWSSPAYRELNPELYACAVAFVRLLVSKHDAGGSELEVSSIEVGRQWNNVDLWARVNDSLLIIIEDKTYSDVHDNQLARYKSEMEEVCIDNSLRLLPIYLKTGTESLAKQRGASEAGYGVVTRSDLVRLFSEYRVDNDIFTDFASHITLIERDIQSFETLPIGEWNWNCWRGFFMYLETRLKAGWGYVPNRQGGFLGFWWSFHGHESGYDVYLQLNHLTGELCFRLGLYAQSSVDPRVVRGHWSELVISRGVMLGLPIIKPSRFGYGRSMNFAVVRRDDWLGSSSAIINKSKIVETLSVYESFLSECIKTIKTKV